jgi:hypothetical protein
MQFLIDNKEFIATLFVVFAVVVVGVYAVPVLKESGKIKDSDLQFTTNLLDIVAVIVGQVKFENEETKDKAVTVIIITKQAIKYVMEMMNPDLTVEEKKSNAFDVAVKTLEELGITVDKDKKDLILAVINSSIK